MDFGCSPNHSFLFPYSYRQTCTMRSLQMNFPLIWFTKAVCISGILRDKPRGKGTFTDHECSLVARYTEWQEQVNQCFTWCACLAITYLFNSCCFTVGWTCCFLAINEQRCQPRKSQPQQAWATADKSGSTGDSLEGKVANVCSISSNVYRHALLSNKVAKRVLKSWLLSCVLHWAAF